MAPRVPSAQQAALDRVPVKPPPFSVKDLRRAIPKHCFERNFFTSFKHLLVDLAMVAGLLFCAYKMDAMVTEETVGTAAPYVRAGLWVAYWIAQGVVMTGCWVLAHECGHGAFAESQVACDAVGSVVHSALLVPYWSWAISHRHHHSNNSNLDRDEVFVPKTEPEFDDNPLLWSLPGRALQCVTTLTLGWPMYLAMDTTSHKREQFNNHFFPWSPMYTQKERVLVVMSDVMVLGALYAYYQIGLAIGFAQLVKFFVIPYMMTNGWLVLITLLQHTDTVLPKYNNQSWDWLRGALSTVDRDFGVCNHFMHHITDTHVAHHLFSKMPFYHAQEATEAIKPVLGEYYRMDRRPVAVAMWGAFRDCAYVREESKGIFWFQPSWAKRQAAGKKAQ